MERDEARAIVGVVMSAWDWKPGPETIEAWIQGLVDLSEFETAELAVVELFKHRARRPEIADVREEYRNQRRRRREEDAARARKLEAPVDRSVSEKTKSMLDGLRRSLVTEDRRTPPAGAPIARSDLFRISRSGRRVGRFQTGDHEWREVWGGLLTENEAKAGG